MPSRIASGTLAKEGKRQESSSFLKKRTKKLLLDSRNWCSHCTR
jgi:hypothetical protein